MLQFKIRNAIYLYENFTDFSKHRQFILVLESVWCITDSNGTQVLSPAALTQVNEYLSFSG